MTLSTLLTRTFSFTSSIKTYYQILYIIMWYIFSMINLVQDVNAQILIHGHLLLPPTPLFGAAPAAFLLLLFLIWQEEKHFLKMLATFTGNQQIKDHCMCYTFSQGKAKPRILQPGCMLLMRLKVLGTPHMSEQRRFHINKYFCITHIYIIIQVG